MRGTSGPGPQRGLTRQSRLGDGYQSVDPERKTKSWEAAYKEGKIRSEFEGLREHVEEYGFTNAFQWYAFVTLDQPLEQALRFNNQRQWHDLIVNGLPFEEIILRAEETLLECKKTEQQALETLLNRLTVEIGLHEEGVGLPGDAAAAAAPDAESPS